MLEVMVLGVAKARIIIITYQWQKPGSLQFMTLTEMVFLGLEEVTAMGMSVSTFKQTDSNKNGKLCKDEFAKMWASPPK